MSDIILDPTSARPEGTGESPAIDLGPAAAPSPAPVHAPAGGLIKESDTQGFMADVIEASQSVPVIVDFWAPWCEPCKTLGPLLEKLVMRAGGLVKMVKINVDENQALAQQLRVQSIPTVYAFKDGQPVDAFAGAMPESQIQSFIDKLIGDAKPPIEAAMDEARALLEADDGSGAENIFSAVLAQDPTYIPALAGLIRAIAAQGDAARADEIIDALDAKTRANAEIDQAVSAVELARQSADADTGQTAALLARVDADGKDLDARLELAQVLTAQHRYEEAIDQLLEIVRIDRAWNDEAGRKQLIQIFDVLGGADPRTQDGRRRLSSVLFS